jgi:hypothetical protein
MLLISACKSRNMAEGDRNNDSLDKAKLTENVNPSDSNTFTKGPGTSPNSSDTAYSPKGTSTNKATEIIHKSPEQEKIDSIKKAKQKLKH